MKFYRVVLTGGPCAGKTSALAFISDHFRSLGWKVYIVQEAATVFLGGGIAPRDITEEQVLPIQKSIVRLMMCLEDGYRDLVFATHKEKPESPNMRQALKLSVDDAGSQSENCLILCDRGIMDASVYCSAEIWSKVLQELSVTEADVKDRRYDCVVHLVTAAQGAEPFYTLASNTVRTETIEEARAVDERTMKAWIGHPYLSVIDNSTNFKEKVVRAVSTICKRVGVSELDKSILKRKFLIKAKLVHTLNDQNANLAVLVEDVESNLLLLHVPELDFKDSECEYTYIMSTDDNTQQRLRMREMLKGTARTGGFVYTHTARSKKRLKESGSYMEEKQNITKREFRKLLRMRLPDHDVVKILKRSFVFQQHHFELSVWQQPTRHRGLVLLETYCDEGANLALPEKYLTIEKEVTNDSQYSMFNLSQRTTPLLSGTIPESEEVAFENELKEDIAIVPPSEIAQE
eukprot:TRINITY_DN905_c0_g1_i1.p1 TRINITY_DN905_c0_g1~~TRINITY_DN905_c0_g1_i1.p1  ORF type:complete len:477 (+),score=87.19 TRINITY_DN905_c0_g1_i1:51-1433(+)